MPDDFVADKPAAESNLKLESEARQTWCAFSRVVSGRSDGETKLLVLPDNVAHNRMGYEDRQSIGIPHAAKCIASACAHWRWRTPSGTRYEMRTFQSEFPAPEGNKGPADVEDGWEFSYWDVGWMKAPHPRYWARRAVEIVLPKGCCGLAGQP